MCASFDEWSLDVNDDWRSLRSLTVQKPNQTNPMMDASPHQTITHSLTVRRGRANLLPASRLGAREGRRPPPTRLPRRQSVLRRHFHGGFAVCCVVWGWGLLWTDDDPSSPPLCRRLIFIRVFTLLLGVCVLPRRRRASWRSSRFQENAQLATPRRAVSTTRCSTM